MSHVNEERGIPQRAAGTHPLSTKKRISHLICIFITSFFGTVKYTRTLQRLQYYHSDIVFLFVTHLCTLIWQRCYDENGKKGEGLLC